MPEEPEIIEEEQETPDEEPETIDPTFTGYKVLIYDRGEENATWQVLLDTSSGENPGIVKASVENKLNEPGQFSYTIAPTHPLYDKTSPMRVYVSVREGQIEIFYGRILSVQTNPLTKLKAVACEGALAFLLDAELPIDDSEREMSAADYFKYCIRQYNSAIKIDSDTYDELRRLRIGDIDVEDSSEIHSFKNGSYTQIQSVMKSQLLNAYDGCFKIRSVPVRNPFGFGPTTYNHYIDWINLVGTLNVSHSVRPGINVIDQTNTKSGEDFFTIIRPVGNNDLTLSGNNGLINVSSSMVDEYGKIIRTVNFDADNESTLRTKANKYIRKLRDNRLTITGDISFVDYNMLIDEVSDGLSVHVGDRVGLYRDLDYIDASAIVESLTRDLLDPSKDKLSLKSDKDLLKSDHASGAAGSNNSGVKASTKISRGGGGGGSSITEYIKSATLSTDGKTLTLTPAHGTPIDFSKATTLEGAWSSGTLTVSAYQTNKGTKTNVGEFVSDHLLALARGGSEISEAFRAELRTVDTGEDVIYPNLRISKDIYLHENVNGANSNVVAGGNIDGSNPVASISVRSTYYAGKASVELNDPTWDPATTTSGTYVESNTAKVRTSGRAHGTVQEQEKEVKVYLTKGTTWTNNKLTVFLHSGTIDGPVQAATEVDASSIRYAGKASVELTDPAWNPTSNPIPSSQKITVQTVNRTDASGRSEEITKETLVFLTQGSTWTNNKLKVYLKSGSTEGTTRAETEVDASSLVSDATTAGINTGKTSVTLTDPTWNPVQSSSYPTSNTVTVRTSGRAHGTVQEAEVTSSVYMVNGTAWSNNKLKVFLHLGSEGGTVLAATEVDASDLVSDATTAGINTGKASVGLNDLTWTPTGATLPESQTITARTSGRTTSTLQEIEKTLALSLVKGTTWSADNKLSVTLKAGSGSTPIAATEVDASELVSATATEARRAGKYSVTLTDPAWNPTGATYPESQKIAVTTVNRTDLSGNPAEITKETLVFLTQGTWSDSRLTVYLKSESAEGTIRASTTIDATTLVLNARRAGKASVGLNDLTWTPTSSPLPERQTITARTTNRTTSSGTPADIVKQLSLNLVKGTTWTDNKLNVTLKAGSGSTPIAATEVDASDLVSDATSAGRAEYKALVRTRFGSSQSGQSASYFIEGYENTSGYASISGSSTAYKLGISGSEDTAVVQIQNLSGTRLSNTEELPIGQLYIDGYNDGNANRGSRILSPTVVTSAAVTALSIGTRYKISSQYQQADGTWASGDSTVVGVPAVSSRFMSGSNDSYYIESYEVTSGATSVPGSTYNYKLGITGEKASSVVQLLTTADGTIANTPTLNVGSLYILGQNDLKDAGGAVGPIESNGTRTLNQYVTTLSVEVPSSAGYRGLEVGKSSESLAFYNRILASTTSTTASIGIGLNTGSVSTGTGVRTVRVYLGGQAGPYAEIYDYRDGKAAERANIKSRFIHDGTNYCIEGYDSSSIESSRTVFTLGVKNSAVRILNSSGNVIGSTPYYSLSNNTYYESGYETGHSDGWNEGGATADVVVNTNASLPSGETSNGTLNKWGKYVKIQPSYTNSDGSAVTITTAEKSLYYKIPELRSKKYTSNGTKTVNAPVSTIEIAVAANIDIDSDSIKWYNASGTVTPPSYDASLNTMGSKIQKGKLGYIYFTVTAADDSKVYRIPIDTR